MDKIAFLIPCYNEALTIAKVVADCHRYLPEAAVYVYDNNSTDGTAELALKAGAIVRHEPQQGKGNVIRTMFREVDAECYLMVDGDDTYDLSSAPEFVKGVLEDHYDMVIGDRLSGAYYQENKRPFHNLGNNLVRSQVNLLFHGKIKDIMTGYRAFSYLFVKTFPVLSKGFEIETEMTIHALDKNMRMKTLTIGYRDRPKGSHSKLNTIRDGGKVLGTISHFYRDYRPLPYFGFFAFCLTAIATGFFVPVLIYYIQNGTVPQVPTLIACCVTYLAAIVCLFTGIILKTLRKKDRQDFEMSLIRADDEFKAKKGN